MKNGLTEIGDVIRDPITGELREVVNVLRPNDLEQFTRGGSYRGSASERCALFGSVTKEEQRIGRAKGRSFNHRGPREAA